MESLGASLVLTVIIDYSHDTVLRGMIDFLNMFITDLFSASPVQNWASKECKCLITFIISLDLAPRDLAHDTWSHWVLLFLLATVEAAWLKNVRSVWIIQIHLIIVEWWLLSNGGGVDLVGGGSDVGGVFWECWILIMRDCELAVSTRHMFLFFDLALEVTVLLIQYLVRNTVIHI